jgi:hypothetical protein
MSTHTNARSQRIERGDQEREPTPLAGGREAGDRGRDADTGWLAGGDRAQARLGTELLYSWRHRFLSDVPAMTPGFARVEMTDIPAPLLPAPIIPVVSSPGLIEITLPDGASVRVDAKVDERALRRVLRVLHER